MPRCGPRSPSVGRYDWLVLSSPNGVHRTFAHLPDARALAGVRVAAVGTGTADALAGYRVVADLVPARVRGRVAASTSFPAPPGGGRPRCSWPAPQVARDVIPDGLRAAGWTVDVVDAYRSRPGAARPTEQVDAVAGADAVTFASSSSVTNLCDAVGVDRVPPVVRQHRADHLGHRPSGWASRSPPRPSPHTIDGLVDGGASADAWHDPSSGV